MPIFILTAAKWLKLPPWLVAAISAVLALLACWGLITFLIHRHDKGVIAAHEAEITNTVNAEVATGTNKADAQDNVVAAHDAVQANQLHTDIGNAVVAHPVEAHHATGPASQAALDRLRQRRK